MKRTINSTAILAVVLLLTAYEASAGIHEVWDQAHFFKPETIVQVDQILADIHEKYHKDLMIETFASIPDDFKTKYQQDGKESRGRRNRRSQKAQLNHRNSTFQRACQTLMHRILKLLN